MTVPFIDLRRSADELREEIDRAIAEVVASGLFILGPQTERFEQDFARACQRRHAVATASGTDALELALRALDVGPGAEVVTQANTCVPTVSAIARAGATPVLCDVESEAGTMDPESLRAAVGPRTRAVIPVHLYGQCAEMDAIAAVAGEKGIPVVEDCAQAHGAAFAGRSAGSFGAAGCFSFYPTKNLGALGDGGAVVTDDDELARRLRLLRQYGQQGRYRHVTAGVNSRFDELQAAVLRCKLPRLEEWNRRRAAIAGAYTRALRDGPAASLRELGRRRHAFHLYVLLVDDRAAFRRAMEERGVATLIHYPFPIHRQQAYRSLATGPVPLTTSEAMAERVVSLPLYPQMTDQEVDAVAGAASQSAAAAAG